MHHFHLKNGELYAEEIKVKDLAAQYGTPLYIYSTATLLRHFYAYDSAFKNVPHLTCFSVKCNSNLSILKLLKEHGSGADIVSGGELYRALKAGIEPNKIVFSGVGKQLSEIEAALEANILMFNIESPSELYKINHLAKQKGKRARISLRINPDVDPQTHPYISTGLKKNKFGINMEQAFELYNIAKELPGVEPIGIDCHIGSQLTEISPFRQALNRLLNLFNELKNKGLEIQYLDIGGGLGIPYSEEEPPPHPQVLGEELTKTLTGYDLTLILEPGRVIAGNAGILVTKVLYIKQSELKKFVVVDAAMNDLIRPSFYEAYHRIAEVKPQRREEIEVDVVGPICETGDFLAQNRKLPQLEEEELLAIFSAGAYGFVMSSQYNSRPRAPEILVDNDQAKMIRGRESYENLVNLELNYL